MRTTFRPFEVSEYALLPQAWKALATRHQAQRDARRARHRSDRIERYQAWRAAQAAQAEQQGPPSTQRAVQNAEDAPVSSAPPQWARTQSRRLGAPAETLFSVVGGAAAAILGQGIAPEAQGGLARPVLRLWDGRGRPAADALASELALVARWARESVHPDALRLRGLGPRGSGVDSTRDARKLCDPILFSERLRLAEQHAHVRAMGEPTAEAASGVPDTRAWVPSGLEPPDPAHSPSDPEQAWRGALKALRTQRPERTRDLEAFLKPLKAEEVDQGVLWLRAPSPDLVHWVEQWMMADLVFLHAHLALGLGFRVAPRA